MHGALVDEEAVRRLAVLPQALAVIAHDDDDGPIEETVSLEVRDHPPHLRIVERDLADVQADRDTSI